MTDSPKQSQTDTTSNADAQAMTCAATETDFYHRWTGGSDTDCVSSPPDVRMEVYVDGSRKELDYDGHQPMKACRYEVPSGHDTAILTIGWSALDEDPEISVSGDEDHDVDNRPAQKLTIITFSVPASTGTTFEWLVSGGHQGFDLTVQTKRKN